MVISIFLNDIYKYDKKYWRGALPTYRYARIPIRNPLENTDESTEGEENTEGQGATTDSPTPSPAPAGTVSPEVTGAGTDSPAVSPESNDAVATPPPEAAPEAFDVSEAELVREVIESERQRLFSSSRETEEAG